jgi:HK97 family phage portal protein
MKTPEEYQAWQAALDSKRAGRNAQVPGPAIEEDHPIEVAPGRGDLRYASWNWGGAAEVWHPSLLQFDNRTVSYAKLYCTQPWVASAVDRMLRWAVRVPLKTYRVGADPYDRDELPASKSPIAAMIKHPWDRASQAQLVQALLGPVLVHGNSITEMDSGMSKIDLRPIDWRFAQPIMPWRDSLEGFRVDTDEAAYARDVSIDKILHVCWWSPTGPLGVSPLMQLGTTLQIEDSAQRYQRATFRQGARPPSAVVVDEKFLGIKPEERREIMANLRVDMTELYSGPENAGKPALLPPGVDWKALGGSVVEAALVDQRKVAREEIAAVYQIPPPMLGILDNATYSNIETQREMIYTECVGPPLILVERCLNSQLIRDYLQIDPTSDVFVEFDFSAVLRGDELAVINATRQAISTALLSPNEGRQVLGRPSVAAPLMDDYYIPTNNLTPVKTLDPEQLAPKQSAAPAPKQPPPANGGPPPANGGPPANDAPPQNALHIMHRGREYVLEGSAR